MAKFKVSDKQDTGPKYVVLHNGVGPHVKGDVISDKHFPDGVDWERLVDLGAVEEYREDADKADEAVVDPLRSENPPTLPAAGVTPPDSAPDEVKDATKELDVLAAEG